MMTELPLNDAIALHKSSPGSYLVFTGDKGVVYTGDDIPEQPFVDHKITVKQFRDRFTDAETLLFLTAMKTDETVSKLNFKLATADSLIDLSSSEVVNGVNYLTLIGVIKADRVTDILTI